jgi:hypothetical protein
MRQCTAPIITIPPSKSKHKSATSPNESRHEETAISHPSGLFHVSIHACPAVAQRVVNKIASFVKVMLRGSIDIFAYYICYLVVLPSHLFGMSEWISASKNDKKDADKKILRRFR